MSRSIHSTRRQLQELLRTNYRERPRRRELIRHAGRQLRQKRLIKRQVKIERHRPNGWEPAPGHADEVPIVAQDEGRFVHFPASIRDLREVMRRLPPDVLGGVRKIALCLGSEHQGPGPDAPHELSPKLDPYVGRDGVEILPGVFSGRYLGTYFFDTSAIQLYAYVYDSSIPDREIRELLLRMRMLVTLMHEIAHHTEQRIRGTRGRWLAMPGNRSERYAESLEYRWARLIVVPYIEEAYRSEVQALQHWMQHHGGIGLPLLTLVEKPRVLFFAAKGALESLIEAVDERRPLKETRLEFARDLHYGEYYDEALAILAVVLADYPDDPEVQALQADIFVHLERYEDAERVAGHVLAANADDVDAWEVLLDVYRALGRWRELEAAATQVLALYEADSWQSRAAHKERAYARIELGAFEEAESDIALLSERKEARYSIIVATLRALLYLRQGCYREALRIAQTRLRTLRPRWHPILSAVRFEAAHRAQRPRDAGKLTTAEWAALRGMGYSAWVERLQESYGRNSWAHRQRP